jgi:hypothetical protein
LNSEALDFRAVCTCPETGAIRFSQSASHYRTPRTRGSDRRRISPIR